jgi:hypothetical protein
MDYIERFFVGWNFSTEEEADEFMESFGQIVGEAKAPMIIDLLSLSRTH